MIPHLSKLTNINDLDNFDQLFSFKKSTQIFIIPKIYNENAPYKNEYNNEYQILIQCKSISNDENYNSFLNNFLTNTDISNKNNYNLALFSVENDDLNFVDMHVLENTDSANFSINLKTSQDLILDDINVVGIYYTQPAAVSINDDILNKNYGNVFTVTVNTLEYDEYNNKYTNYYMFPDSQSNILASDPTNFVLPRVMDDDDQIFKDFTYSTLQSEKAQMSYSNNNFDTKDRIKQYRTEQFDHVIPDVSNDKNIAIVYKTIPIAPYVNIDIYKEGILHEYKLNNITSVQWIDDNTFQIVKDCILYECNLHQETGTFYNLIELENLNTYLNGAIKYQENIIKYGSNIISEKQGQGLGYSTHQNCNIYINGQEFPLGESVQGSGENYITQGNDYKFGMDMIQPILYEFKDFIIFPRKRTILPINIKDTYQKKTVYNENDSVYIANREEDSIVKIENFNNIKLLENDAKLISESGNSAFYKMKSNIAFEQLSSEPSLIKIYNNIGDINGAFKNVESDTTNHLFLKIDDYDNDLTAETVTFELSINYPEMKALLNSNKFIKLLNNNTYYLKQNNYIFNSISELKTNLMNVLNDNFYLDEINLSTQTTENGNYIDNVFGIQSTIDSDLFVIKNNIEQLKFGYNFLELNNSFNSITDLSNHKSEFKIDQFISADGIIYQENEIDYKLYNINNDVWFKLIVTAKKEYILGDTVDNIINIEYLFDSPGNCESSYLINNVVENLTNVLHDTTTIDFINDTTAILLNSIDSTSMIFEENIELNEEIILNKDETLNIDISLENFNLDNDINNKNIFSSYQYNDFIDIHIKDDYYNHNICHFDFIGKSFNTYKINLSNDYKFYTFGNLPKKCKTQLSTWYDYSESNIVNEFYGDYSNGILYNLMEQNSSKYFIERYIANESFTEPTNANNSCDAYYIKQNDIDLVTLSTTQSLDVQPIDKESHTLFINANVDELIAGGNTMYTDYEQRFYLAKYGINYTAMLNGISANEQIIGNSIKPITQVSNSSIQLFNKDNCNGYNLYDHYDNTSANNLCFTFNKYSDSTNQVENSYLDSTVMETVEYHDRINEYFSNGYPINKNFDYGSPLLNDYKNKTSVTYMSDFFSESSSQTYAGNLWNHIIDFDYELSQDEIEYLSNNLTDILSKVYDEKRKMGQTVINNDFKYKYVECGSYIYDIPRSSVNIKLERKYSIITIYVNDIIVDEILTNDEKSYISNIINWGNLQSGNKKISMYKTKNIVTKKSGLWC